MTAPRRYVDALSGGGQARQHAGLPATHAATTAEWHYAGTG